MSAVDILACFFFGTLEMTSQAYVLDEIVRMVNDGSHSQPHQVEPMRINS